MANADWRAERVAAIGKMIQQALPDASVEAKWKKPSNPAGVPTWLAGGIICTVETYRDKVKLTFAKGARLADPTGLFNASLDGNARRAIDLHEDDRLDAEAFAALARAAAALNAAG